MSIMGSRDQLCVNPEVASLESSVAKQFACINKVTKKACEYYQRVDIMLKTNSPLETDIEDLGDLRRAAQHQK